jgi:hypothetical protein
MSPMGSRESGNDLLSGVKSVEYPAPDSLSGSSSFGAWEMGIVRFIIPCLQIMLTFVFLVLEQLVSVLIKFSAVDWLTGKARSIFS